MLSNIQNFTEEKLTDYVNLLRRMVEINSFTGNPDGVNKLGELTAKVFAPLGFHARHIQANNPHYGKHLILTRPGTSKKTIGMISHLDTVFPPDEETAHDFSWRESGDRLYGPGTNDCKGGTVMMLMTLEALQKFAPQEFNAVTWVLLLNAAEERLSDDFGELCLEELGENALAALVVEAGVRTKTGFQLVTARKGRATYKVSVEGKASHAGSNHPEGANAIVQMAHTVQQIAALTNYEQDLTFNVGTISGGTVVNRVPHQAQATVEMRAFSSDVFDAGVQKMLELQNQAQVSNHNGNYQCSVTIELSEQSAPWPKNPGTENLLAVWQAAGDDIGITVEREERGGLSDGNAIWQALPTIDGLGPYGANAHCSERSTDGSKDQEFANKSSFAPKALLNVLAIQKLIANK